MVILKKFWAPWCVPCKSLGIKLHKVLEEYPEVKLEEINIDEDVESAINYKVRSIPTLILIADGKEKRLIGNCNENEIKEFLNK